MKKLLSIILAILMIVTTVPMAFAAEDGFVEVSTEAELIAALENGGNIMLTGDITASDEYRFGYDITKNTTIDLNGHTLTAKGVFSLLGYEENIVLTISGNGTVKNTDPNFTSAINGYGTLNLLGGTIEGGADIFGTTIMSDGWVDEMNTDKHNSDEDTSSITGGHVEALGIKYGTIIISGGTFGFNPTAYLAEGYTATEANGIWVVTCADGCNFSYTDNEDGTHIGNCTKCGYEVIEEHTLETVEAKAPTCTEIGWEAYEYCTACDYTTYVEIPSNGHTPLEAVTENEVAPKCGVAGSYDLVVYCDDCGAELDRDTVAVDALKHSFTKYETTEEAKCGVEGKEVAYCDNGCGETDEKAIEALKHDIVIDEAVAPKCGETGLTQGEHCTRCDYKVEQEAVPALTHKDADGDYKCDNGCGHEFEKPAPEEPTPDTPDEPEDETCADCGKVHTNFFSEIICFFTRIINFIKNLFA